MEQYENEMESFLWSSLVHSMISIKVAEGEDTVYSLAQEEKEKWKLAQWGTCKMLILGVQIQSSFHKLIYV